MLKVRVSSVSRLTLAAVVLAAAGLPMVARAQAWDENPPVMLQWFECPWQDMEHRMPDFFLAGYGAVWVPPVSRGYMPPTNPNQNSSSAGYDVFDRFNLGTPSGKTAYGTEQGFDAVISEFHKAAGLVYVEMVLNHNAGRQTGAGFQTEGGYPGFWMASAVPAVDKQPTDNWGDFHGGVSGGYRQSENPNGANYCLQAGDLVSLIDINHGSSNSLIRQPTIAGNPLNIPGGTYFNKVDPNNARFYPDPTLGTDTVNNPGMSTGAGALTTSPFSAFPCNVPARNEPASQFTLGRFNTGTPMGGVPVGESATGYLLRWTQWMLDVHHVDGFRIDAIKHMPSWFYDTYYDATVSNRRVTPDGRHVTPYSFGESVEGNDFTFDRYVRKPNGRASGRTGDSFGNRDALDLTGAGASRDLVNNQAWASWSALQSAHLDNADDGYNNGSVGVNHVFSHDNGSTGDGGSMPGLPSAAQQGWFAHAYMLMKPGQAAVYHNARGIVLRASSGDIGGFFPREGVPVALGFENSFTPNPVISTLVQLSNQLGRGYYFPRWSDGFVNIFERSSPVGAGYSGNCLVGCNRSYAGLGITSYDERTVATTFPQGTRLIEMTGNAARADVDPSGQIGEVLTVAAGGNVTIRVPRNQNLSGVTHHRGFVVYAPAIPGGTLSFSNVASTIPADATGAAVRRRMASIPVITASAFDLTLTTINGDSGAGNNDNADDNAVFRFNQGYQDLNASGGVDIDYTSDVVGGYEQFVTQHQPLAGTGNTNGIYRQTIDAGLLPEGVNYVSVAAFRKRGTGEAALFREFRAVVYIDRQCPQVTLNDPGAIDASTWTFSFTGTDRTPNRVQMWLNPAVGTDLVALATSSPTTNLATRYDRLVFQRATSGMHHGSNTLGVVVFEESGHGCVQYFDVFVNLCKADVDDGTGTGTPDGGIDINDLLYFLGKYEAGDLGADLDDGSGTGTPDGGVDINDLLFFLARYEAGC